MNTPLLIGITGGSGSGKSTIADRIYAEVPEKSMIVISQDSYYKDQSHLDLDKRQGLNYDTPDSFDNKLLFKHLEKLKNGQYIEMPIYDHVNHIRQKETETIEPKEIIVVEGITALYDKNIRDLLDIKIYVDTEADIRLLRIIMRDMSERNLPLETVISKYVTAVRPAHEQFVEPTKKYADIIITEGGNNLVAIDLMVTKIKSLLKK